ncbi:ParBc, ParB-like nuclease domain OS=Blastopirellula marina DSM 3645 GN=DSM3645_27843 PE=4 SV=1: ParBc [Gemmata massiliana]|uniref:ParB/Spo0J HTH domain-containing protein n=1 Tax=Gemmata massiliana TaxID=1210884 RepID=A0A6P2CWA5_9BACT|nr:ParB/RepB/Spo0J family partition protein [Gemmata massiliana]VTR93418.1 ParBc, ParB-like nuclease domain OS=Blastopirellula marina DSM 3645 GN=DSM3645_27843 PE=4 SV=1: ParBc [Gemmata massiliana]
MTALRLITVPLTACDIAYNPRAARAPASCRSLGENIRTHGQKVPIVGFFKSDRFQVADGGCRVEGMRLVGLTEVLALDWGKEPTPADLMMAHASIDLHRQFLPPLDRARLFRSLIDARGCTAKQLARDLSVSDSLVGRYLSLLVLPTDLQERVSTGTLEFSKACVVAQEPDPARQRELATMAPDLPRDALAERARKARPANTAAPKVGRIRIELASGTAVTVSGAGLTLDDAIGATAEAHKKLKQGRDQGLTAKTISRISAERSNATS